MKQQTQTITANVTESIIAVIDTKLKPLQEENAALKIEVEILRTKVQGLEKASRKNNLILHGLKETEVDTYDLMKKVITTLDLVTKTAELKQWDEWEISNVYRIGKKNNKKTRPIRISLNLLWRKTEMLKNKKYLPDNIYITEDYPKDIQQKRKELKVKLQEELDKGNEAYIAYDQLIIKDKKDKRKRMPTDSPNSPSKPIRETNKIFNKTKINKIDSFVRSRSFSTSENSKHPQ